MSNRSIRIPPKPHTSVYQRIPVNTNVYQCIHIDITYQTVDTVSPPVTRFTIVHVFFYEPTLWDIMCLIICSYQRFKTSIIYPSSLAHYFWLVIISIAILYNMTMIIARLVFDQLRMDYWKIWLITDYICDSIYILDILVRFKTGTQRESSHVLITCIIIISFSLTLGKQGVQK